MTDTVTSEKGESVKQKFEFGQNVTDMVTGYEGEITQVVLYANGDEPQYMVESIDDVGRPVAVWIPEGRLMPFEKEVEDEDRKEVSKLLP